MTMTDNTGQMTNLDLTTNYQTMTRKDLTRITLQQTLTPDKRQRTTARDMKEKKDNSLTKETKAKFILKRNGTKNYPN